MGVFHDVTNSYISLYCSAALFSVQGISYQKQLLQPQRTSIINCFLLYLVIFLLYIVDK